MDEFTRRRITKNPTSTAMEAMELAYVECKEGVVSTLPGYTLAAVMICAICRDERGSDHLITYRGGLDHVQELGYMTMFTDKLVHEWKNA